MLTATSSSRSDASPLIADIDAALAARQASIAASVRLLMDATPVSHSISAAQLSAAQLFVDSPSLPVAVSASVSSASAVAASPPSSVVVDVLLLPLDSNLFPLAHCPRLTASKQAILFIRKSYVVLLEQIVAAKAVPKTVVTGTPGLGKTNFGYYLLWHLLHEFKTTASLEQRDIVYMNEQARGLPICFSHIRLSRPGAGSSMADAVTIQCKWYDMNDGTAELRRLLEGPIGPSSDLTWYIVDGMQPFSEGLSSRMVVLSSPRRETLHDLLKANKDQVRQVWMPSWTWAELATLRAHHESLKLQPTLTVDQVTLTIVSAAM